MMMLLFFASCFWQHALSFSFFILKSFDMTFEKVAPSLHITANPHHRAAAKTTIAGNLTSDEPVGNYLYWRICFHDVVAASAMQIIIY